MQVLLGAFSLDALKLKRRYLKVISLNFICINCVDTSSYWRAAMPPVPFVCGPHGASFPSNDVKLAFYFAKFNAEFPTEEHCIEELCRRADTSLPECRHCGNSLVNKQFGDRVSRCQNCSRQTWHTAGTFFEGIRLGRAWLAAIYLMEHGVFVSSSRFHRVLGIAQSTALNMLQKLRAIIRMHMDDDGPTISSAVFVTVFRKRSFMTPAKAHPRAEQEEIDRISHDDPSAAGSGAVKDVAASLAADIGARYFGRSVEKSKQKEHVSGSSELDEAELGGTAGALAAEDSASRQGGLSGHEKAIYDSLSDKPVAVDKLCDLTGLEAADVAVSLLILELAQLVNREPGDHYVRCKQGPHSVTANSFRSDDSGNNMTVTVIASIDFVIQHCHGISRKYLQNYLAAYWCYSDRATWRPGSLLKLCRQSPSIKYAEILGYVSPPMVKVLSESHC